MLLYNLGFRFWCLDTSIEFVDQVIDVELRGLMRFILNLWMIASGDVLRRLDRYLPFLLRILLPLETFPQKILEVIFFIFNDLFLINRYFADGELNRRLLEIPKHSVARHRWKRSDPILLEPTH